MITEAYVSFETAKLLKEKGFDEVCHSYYDIRYENQLVISELNLTQDDDSYLAPTQQMAMRWLRKRHKLHCNVVLKDITEDTYVYSIADLGDNRHWIRGEYLEYPSCEEACEAAIKYCLENLI